MAQLDQTTKHSYRIWRKPESYEFDFDPPLKSDELFAAMKDAFPYLKTHQLRMAEAVIRFCRLEQQANDHNSSPEPFPSPKFNFPSQGTSSQATTPTSNEQGSDSTKLCSLESNQRDRMNSMSSILSFPQKGKSERRVKKAMTSQDLKDYRHRKRAGACLKHRKAKRKCPPNCRFRPAHEENSSSSQHQAPKNNREAPETSRAPVAEHAVDETALAFELDNSLMEAASPTWYNDISLEFLDPDMFYEIDGLEKMNGTDNISLSTSGSVNSHTNTQFYADLAKPGSWHSLSVLDLPRPTEISTTSIPLAAVEAWTRRYEPGHTVCAPTPTNNHNNTMSTARQDDFDYCHRNREDTSHLPQYHPSSNQAKDPLLLDDDGLRTISHETQELRSHLDWPSRTTHSSWNRHHKNVLSRSRLKTLWNACDDDEDSSTNFSLLYCNETLDVHRCDCNRSYRCTPIGLVDLDHTKIPGLYHYHIGGPIYIYAAKSGSTSRPDQVQQITGPINFVQDNQVSKQVGSPFSFDEKFPIELLDFIDSPTIPDKQPNHTNNSFFGPNYQSAIATGADILHRAYGTLAICFVAFLFNVSLLFSVSLCESRLAMAISAKNWVAIPHSISFARCRRKAHTFRKTYCYFASTLRGACYMHGHRQAENILMGPYTL